MSKRYDEPGAPFDEPDTFNPEVPTPCAAVWMTHRASMIGPEEWDGCEDDAVNGGEYCERHRDCEEKPDGK